MPNITIEGPKIEKIEVKRALVKELTDAAEKAYTLPRQDEKVAIKQRIIYWAAGGEMNVKRVVVMVASLLSLLLVGTPGQCEKAVLEDNEAREMKKEQVGEAEKIKGIYGEIKIVERNYSRIMIEEIDIRDEDVRQALQEGDYIKIKIVRVYPSLGLTLAETIPLDKIRQLRKGSKKLFVTKSFEELTQEIESFTNEGDKWFSQKAYGNAVSCYRKALMKDVFSIYPETRNKLALALEQELQEKAKREKQEFQKQSKIVEQEKQQKEKQDDLKTFVKTVEHHDQEIQGNSGVVFLVVIIFVVCLIIFISFRKQRDRRKVRNTKS